MLREFAKYSLWPAGLLPKVGLVLGALSLLALVEYGFRFGIGPTIGLVLEYYDQVLHVFLGWAEPYLQALLDRLVSYVDLELELYDHWKHVLVLMTVYFIRDARRDLDRSLPVTATFDLVLGLLVALFSSVAAGTVQARAADMSANFALAGIPIAGLFVYDLIYMMWAATFLREKEAAEFHEPTPSWWSDVLAGSPWLLGRTIGGYALLWVGLQAPFVQQFPSPGLVMLTMLIVALALYWLWEATITAAQLRDQGETWTSAYWRTGMANLGAAMLGVFLWSGVFLLSNAGLRLFGL